MSKLEIENVFKDSRKERRQRKREEKPADFVETRGRKSKYEDDMPDRLIDLMAKGFSFEACCGDFRISKQTGYEWVKAHPEFAEAKAIGETVGQYYWENEAKEGLWGSKDSRFNTTTFIFVMKNRFGWRDRKEITGDINVSGNAFSEVYKTYSETQITKEIDAILDRFKPVVPKGPTRL